jgi:glutamate synthase domain-containing protein 3
MSGGIAYVFDEDGEFQSTRCNKTGVDLELLFESKDIDELRNLVAQHVEYTASPRGKWILENWNEMLPRFIKVFPHEFKRVLGAATGAEQLKIAPQFATSHKPVAAAQGGSH